MKQLQTRYRIRARVTADIVNETNLISEARLGGVELKPDSEGNIEGVWDATQRSLDDVVEELHDIGLRGFMIQQSMISIVVAVSAEGFKDAEKALKKVAADAILQTADIFTGDKVLSCMVPCEAGMSLKEELEMVKGKIVATECFVVVKENING